MNAEKVMSNNRVTVLLFSCSADDFGWEDDPRVSPQVKEGIDLLHNAIVADIAEKLSEEPGYHIVLYETRDSYGELPPSIPSKVERVSQEPGLLYRRVQEALRERAEQAGGAPLVVLLSRNPLYPKELLTRGIELLGQEDDVIAYGEGGSDRQGSSLMWIAMKKYHPEVFESNNRWWEGGMSLLQAIVEAHAIVMPVSQVRNILTLDDLGYLYHEIEREVLLKQWYPVRTYEVLYGLRRRHLIPEVSE